jgi:predicted ATPase
MQEFAMAQGGLTLTGASYAAGQVLPYQPLTQALRLALSLRDRWRCVLPIWLTELARLLPELRAHFPDLPHPVEAAPQQAQARLFEALTQTFFSLASDSPLLLCLDALQWADDATLGWLTYVAHRLSGSSVCILATYRSLDVGRLVDWQRVLERAGMAELIHLAGLSETSVAELLRRAGADQVAGPSLAARIHAATGGNAFFALEIIRTAQATGQFDGDGAQLPLPQTVRDAVLRRVSRLTPLAQQVLAAAAVLAPELRVATLMECAGRSETEIIESLEELLAHQLLRADGVAFRFQHDLARQAVYAETSPWRRRLLHQRTAESLARLPAADQSELAAVIAVHFMEAGEVAQAIPYYQRAAALAQRLYAHQEAVGYLRQAIALAEGQPAMAAAQLALREALADALAVAGHFAQAEASYRAAQGQIAGDERLRRASLQLKLARTLPPQQRAGEAVTLYSAALMLLDERDDRAGKELRLELLLGLMDALYHQLRVEAMAELEKGIQTLLKEVGTTARRAYFYSQLNQMGLIRERYRLSSATVELIRNGLAYGLEAGDVWQITHLRFGRPGRRRSNAARGAGAGRATGRSVVANPVSGLSHHPLPSARRCGPRGCISAPFA